MNIQLFLKRFLILYLINSMVMANTGVILNFEGASIKSITEIIAKETNKNFLLDPRIRDQKITLISEKPVSKEDAYSLFISILKAYGYGLIESDNLIKIIPINEVKQNETTIINVNKSQLKGDIMATAIISLKNIKAEQMTSIIRPMVPNFGQVIAHGDSNSVIILAPKSVLNKVKKIITELENRITHSIQIVSLKNSVSTEIVSIITRIEKKAIAKTNGLLIIEDKTSNQIILSGGTKEDRYRAISNIKKLDKSKKNTGNTQVIYLNYAKAKGLVAILKDLTKKANAQSKNKLSITADENTNSIIIQAPTSLMQEIKSTIKKLDIRKSQVLVQAIIIEISDNKAAELGVRWILNTEKSVGLIDFTGAGNLINLIAGNAGQPNPGALGTGSSIVVGNRFGDSSHGWGALLKALRSNSEVNILSTPSVVALDNEDASIIVGQEIPFITGQSTQNNGNPFTTIQRKEVGLKLNITPQINAGNAIQLKIEQEVSNLQASARIATGASDIITSKRNISTSVIINDNEILILGGLTTNQTEESVESVPVLSDIPLIGKLFTSSRNQLDKRTLMIFIKANIIRNSENDNSISNEKYSEIYEKSKQRKALSLISDDKNSMDLSIIKDYLDDNNIQEYNNNGNIEIEE